MLWALAVLMQQPASDWQSSNWSGAQGGRWRHHMEAMHSKNKVKKTKKRAEGGGVGATNSPQMKRWRACRKRKVLGAYDVLKSCTVLPNTKQLITAQKTWQLSRVLHTQKDKHGQNCRSDCGVSRRLETEEAVLFTKRTPTSEITSQSVVHNIAELKRVGIL